MTEYYLRFVASNTGEALSKIVALIEASDVAVEKAITKGNNIVVITGKSKESCMQDIISRIKGLSSVDSLGALVRIEK